VIELSVNQKYDQNGIPMSRTIGHFEVDETDPTAEPKITQTFDGRTLYAVLKVLNGMKEDMEKAAKEWE
jgi:hypothetical protein